MTTPNLIQQFTPGIAAAELLQLKEKTPFPTLGDVLTPVLIVEDLRTSGRQPVKRWMVAVQNQGPIVGLEFPFLGIAHAAGNNEDDRIVVDHIRLHSSMAGQVLFHVSVNIDPGQISGTGIQSSSRVPLMNPSTQEIQFTQLAPLSGFTQFILGRTTLNAVNGDITLAREASAQIYVDLPGPFLLLPGRVLLIRHNDFNAGSVISGEIWGREYPA